MTPETAPVSRRERDAYVAHAFAAADVLMTLDPAGVIVEAHGAVRAVFAAPPEQILGHPFADNFVAEDRPLLVALLDQLRLRGRFERVQVTIAPASGPPLGVVLGGCVVPTIPDRAFLSLARHSPAGAPCGALPRDAESGLLDAAGFQAAALASATDTADTRPRELALVSIPGFGEIAAGLDRERRAALMARLGGVLRARALDGTAAGQIGPEAFGVIAGQQQDAKEIGAEITAIVRSGTDNPAVEARASGIDLALGRLTGANAAKALAYTLKSFVETHGERLPPASLSSRLAEALAGTSSRLGSLREIISRQTFVAAFQPVVSLDGRAIHHFEALARFPEMRDAGGTIRFAEEVGMIPDFDLAMTARVLQQFVATPRATIAVNLSGVSVELSQFRGQLLELLARHRAIAPRLLFELTESALIQDILTVVPFLRDLRRQGYRVCLDDFGAGAAAYGYLRQFEVDFVKIDGPFLRAAVGNPREQAMLRSIAGLGRDLGYQLIGEMIETEAEAALARSLGMSLGQGWLFGRPNPDLPASPERRAEPTAALKARAVG